MVSRGKTPAWYLKAAAAIESGMNLREAATEAGVAHSTLYNRRQTDPRFKKLCDEAEARYHREHLNAIERVGAELLEKTYKLIGQVDQEETPNGRALMVLRLQSSLDKSYNRHLRWVEKTEGVGKLTGVDPIAALDKLVAAANVPDPGPGDEHGADSDSEANDQVGDE